MPLDAKADLPNRPTKKEVLRTLQELVAAERAIKECTEELASARGVKRGVLQRFEGKGGSKPVIQELRRVAKMDDDERRAYFDTLIEYAGWAEQELWTPGTADKPQGALFADDPETAEAKQALRDTTIRTDAFNTWKEGGAADDNPHPVGSRDHQTWATEFERSGAKAEKNAGRTASTARKPGRPRKSAEATKRRKNGSGDAATA